MKPAISGGFLTIYSKTNYPTGL